MNEQEVFVLTQEEIAKVRLNFLTHCIILIKSLVMIPISYVTFLLHIIKGIFTIPSITVNVIFNAEKVKKLIRQKLKDKNANL